MFSKKKCLISVIFLICTYIFSEEYGSIQFNSLVGGDFSFSLITGEEKNSISGNNPNAIGKFDLSIGYQDEFDTTSEYTSGDARIFIEMSSNDDFLYGADFSLMGLQLGITNKYLYGSIQPKLYYYISDCFGLCLFPFITGKIFLAVDDENNITNSLNFGIEVGVTFNPLRKKLKEKQLLEANLKLERQRIQQEEQAKEKALQEEIELKRKELYDKTLKINTINEWINFYKYYPTTSYRIEEIENILLKQYQIDEIEDFPWNINPFGYSENTLYFSRDISINQWLNSNCFLGKESKTGSSIFIENCYAILPENMNENLKIKTNNVYNTYLQYLGTYSYTAVSGSYETVPKFNIIYFR